MNRDGRPRRQLDEAKLARARMLWLSGKMSFTSAARIAGTTRDVLRLRWPEFAAWAEAKRRKSRATYHKRNGGNGHEPDA